MLAGHAGGCRTIPFVGHPDTTRVNCVLSQLCLERGWCLPPAAFDQVREAVPLGIDTVVDLIIRIELEIEPLLCDAESRRWLHGKVDDWLFHPQGRGALSGLPL